MSQWKWNNISFDIDMGDADFQERYEDAFEKMAENENTLMKEGKTSELTRAYCKLYFDLFDNLFGKGTSDKLFEGKANSGRCEDCYDSFIDFCNSQVVQINKKRTQRISKYTVKKRK